MNEPARIPSKPALVTEALFHGPNVGLLVGGLILGVFCWSWHLVRTIVWLGAIIAYAIRVNATLSSPAFIAKIANEEDDFEPHHATLVTSGPFQREVMRVIELQGAINRAVKALPEGPAKIEFVAFLPHLEDLVVQVNKLSRSGARIKQEAGPARRQQLEAEIAGIEGKLKLTTDAQAKQSFEVALKSRKEALERLGSSAGTLERLEAQLSATVGSLESVKARVIQADAAVQGDAGGQVGQKVESLCKDVKYLSESLEETTRLLT